MILSTIFKITVFLIRSFPWNESASSFGSSQMSACKHIQNFNSVRKGLFDFLSTIQEDSELVDLYPSIFDCATMMTLSSIFLFVGLCKIKTCDLHIYQQGIKLKGYPTKTFNSVNSVTSFTSRTIKVSLNYT